ncbi:NAD(P)-dependent alcohol dehydrogenase [Patescibacteria group bacterium]|nr:NAD(P)-dependent alcohol dehydrogenase [Patescibacteria group bacterium]
MKAIICTNYGGPEVLKLVDVPKPTITDTQVLIKVMASAVNSGDVRTRGLVVPGFLRIVMRMVLGFRKPRQPILGVVLSGVIESVGSKVAKWKVGDEVFALTGFRFGGHAEYAVLKENSTMELKPKNASFNEAAAIVFGGATAIYFLEAAGIKSCSQPQILIYGASGAVGTAAVQIAKSHGANVTAVCGEAGVDLVTSLGADSILVYTKDDFTKLPEKFDIVFDAVGKTTKKQCKHLLKEGGVYKTVGGLETAAERVSQLQYLRELYEAGKYRPVIDRIYPLEEMVAAHTYVDSGMKKGNVVIEVGR